MYYVLFRNPESLLVSDFEALGRAPIAAFESKDAAIEMANRLVKEMNYDVQVVQSIGVDLFQRHSRTNGVFDSQ